MIRVNIPSDEELLLAYCRESSIYSVYLYLYHESETDIENCLLLWRDYWDDITDVTSIDDVVVFLADTEEEMLHIYNHIRGPHGLPSDPTPGTLYAKTCIA